MNLREVFLESARIKESFIRQNEETVLKAFKEVARRIKEGAKLLICGNGGSAADAQHIAAELVGRFSRDRKPISAVALTTDTSILTAVGNDYGFDKIFERQVEAIGKKGDVLLAISTSGNSKNVIEAVKKAKDMGLFTLGFLGKDGGELRKIVDAPIVVNSNSTPRIQEVHITLGHALCQFIEEYLFYFPPFGEGRHV